MGNPNWRQISCGIRFSCTHVPLIQSFHPSYCVAFAPSLPPPSAKLHPSSLVPIIRRAPLLCFASSLWFFLTADWAPLFFLAVGEPCGLLPRGDPLLPLRGARPLQGSSPPQARPPRGFTLPSAWPRRCRSSPSPMSPVR